MLLLLLLVLTRLSSWQTLAPNSWVHRAQVVPGNGWG